MKALIAYLALSVAVLADAPVALQWTGSDDPDVTGYRVKWGAQSGVYAQSVEAFTDLTWTISLPPGKWFIAVVTYDALGLESAPSNEVTVIVARVRTWASADLQTWKVIAETDVLVAGEACFYRTTIDTP